MKSLSRVTRDVKLIVNIMTILILYDNQNEPCHALQKVLIN